MKKKNRYLKKICAAFLVVVFLLAAAAGTGFYLYTRDYYHAQTQDFPPDDETEKYLIYGDKNSSCGLIFYPGAKVEEAAYAPMLSQLSENGICCVVVKMPFHLAVLGKNGVAKVREEIPGVTHWYLGGHSLGGAMAADFAAEGGDWAEGVILLAAYPTRDLGDLPVLSLYGNRDGVLNWEKYMDAMGDIANLTEHVVKGGNHAGFGDYGEQKGDKEAEISGEAQWQETVSHILDFLYDTGGLEEPKYPIVTSSELTKDIVELFPGEDIYCIYRETYDSGEKGEYLYIDQEGEPLTGEIYTRGYPFQEGLACCLKEGRYGFLDREGNAAIPFVFEDAAPFSEGLAYFCKDDRYGFMDDRGNPVFYLDCDSVSSFSEGLAHISVDGKYGYIDRSGKTVIEPKYQDADYFKDGFAKVMEEGKWGIIDKTGHEVIPTEYAKVERQKSCFMTENDGNYSFFDLKGNLLLEKPCNYQGPVRGVLENGVGLCFENEGTSGFICDGEAFLFDEIYDFPELIPERDLVIAKKDEFFGVMDFAGNIKIPFQQSYVSYQEKDGVFFVRNSNQCSVVNAENFSERMTGEYDDIVPFLEGQAIVEKNERYGIIDLSGNIKMPVSCQEIHVLDNGAYWYKKGKTYLYDKNGLLLTKGNYSHIAWEDGCYSVETNGGEMGFLNARGKEIFLGEYSEDHRYGGEYRLLNPADFDAPYAIIKTGEGDDADKVFCNRITPRIREYQEFLRSGSYSVDDMQSSHEVQFSELNGNDLVTRLYDFSNTGRPVLYVFANAYGDYVCRKSHSGFFAIKGEEVVCLLSGFECGGTARGDYVSLWYDKEERKVLYGSSGTVGGIGGIYTYNTVCDETDGILCPEVSFEYTGMLHEDSLEQEYEVNGETVLEEDYRRVEERYQEMELPKSNNW